MFLLKLFPLYALMLWAGDAGAGGGATDTGAGDLPPGDPPPAGGAPTGGGQPGSSFTQADLDRIAGQTRKEALKKWAKDLGYDDPKAIEDLIKAQKDAEEQSKGDLQKAKDAEAREKTARELAEQRLTNTVLRSAFDRVAMDKVADLDLAYLAAQNAGLLNGDSGIVIDVEKNSVAGLDKVIEKLLKDKPILKKTAQGSPAGTGGSEGGNSNPGPTEEQDNQARRTYGIRPQRG